MLSYLNVRANMVLFHFSFSTRIRNFSLAFYTTITFDSYKPPTFAYKECFYYLFPKLDLVLYLVLIDPDSIKRDHDRFIFESAILLRYTINIVH